MRLCLHVRDVCYLCLRGLFFTSACRVFMLRVKKSLLNRELNAKVLTLLVYLIKHTLFSLILYSLDGLFWYRAINVMHTVVLAHL